MRAFRPDPGPSSAGPVATPVGPTSRTTDAKGRVRVGRRIGRPWWQRLIGGPGAPDIAQGDGHGHGGSGRRKAVWRDRVPWDAEFQAVPIRTAGRHAGHRCEPRDPCIVGVHHARHPPQVVSRAVRRVEQTDAAVVVEPSVADIDHLQGSRHGIEAQPCGHRARYERCDGVIERTDVVRQREIGSDAGAGTDIEIDPGKHGMLVVVEHAIDAEPQTALVCSDAECVQPGTSPRDPSPRSGRPPERRGRRDSPSAIRSGSGACGGFRSGRTRWRRGRSDGRPPPPQGPRFPGPMRRRRPGCWCGLPTARSSPGSHRPPRSRRPRCHRIRDRR